MSTHLISIVPRISEYPNHKQKIKEVITWLQESRIIQSELSLCNYNNLGYDIGLDAKKVVKHPDQLPVDLNSRGLEVVENRMIFSTYSNGIETVICPSCKLNFADEDWSFFNEWASNDSNNLACPLCKSINDIHSYKFDPNWGFSNVGFTFWNWPEFTDEFLYEFERKLGVKIDVVNAHI